MATSIATEILQKRIDGVKAEYAIRTSLAEKTLDQRVIDGQIGVDLTTIKTGDDVQLNALKQLVQRDIANIEADAKLEMVRLEGRQKVDLSELSSSLGLDRSRVIGEAGLKGKSAVAKQRALNRLDITDAENTIRIETSNLKNDAKQTLAGVEGGFKKDIAKLEGEFKVVLSGIDADNVLRISDIQASGIHGIGRVDKNTIESEARTKIQLIDRKKITDEVYQRVSDAFQAGNIRIMGGLDDTNTRLAAELDASLISDDSIATIGTMGSELLADIANIEGEHSLNMGNVSGRLLRDLQYITDQANEEGKNIIDLAVQESNAKAFMNRVRIESVNADKHNTLTELGNDNRDKISRINNMKTIAMENKRSEALIDYFVIEEEGRIKVKNADDVLTAKLDGSIGVTNERANFIKTRESTRVANETLVIKAENEAMKSAADTQATAISTNATTRISELNTISLNDYKAALFQAKLRALATKRLADADAGQEKLDAKDEVGISKDTFDIVREYDLGMHSAKAFVEEGIATMHKKTSTTRFMVINGNGDAGGISTWGGSGISITYPKLLEEPK